MVVKKDRRNGMVGVQALFCDGLGSFYDRSSWDGRFVLDRKPLWNLSNKAVGDTNYISVRKKV